MNDALGVRGLDAIGYLPEDQHCLVPSERTTGDTLRQRLALDQLHDQELPALGFFEAVERGDVGVIQLCKKTRLSLEALRAFLVPRKFLGKNFDSDVTAELRVLGAVNLTHTPFANGLEDFVVS